MTTPVVSVLTPVYNGGRFLEECIASVLHQTFADFEYVIADNASTDDTIAIARRFAESDPRVRIVEQTEHLRLHLAHWNRSLPLVDSAATYVKIVHADDWLFENCLERMVAAAERNPSVGVVGAYRLDEDRVTLDGLPPSTTFVPGHEVARSYLLGGPLPFLFGSPSSLLIRAALVREREPFYNEQNLHADTEACLALLAVSDFAFVHEVLTYTRRHNESETSRSTRLGTNVPSDVDMFQRLGGRFLSEEEYDRKLVVHLVHYLRLLASRPRSWLSAEFRAYHYERLRVFLGRTTARKLIRGTMLQLRRSSRASHRLPEHRTHGSR